MFRPAARRAPADSEDFEATAVRSLLDVVLPDYRLYGVLRRASDRAGASRRTPGE